MIRPAARESLARWRETALSAAVVLAGLWIATRGGPILAVAGVLLAALGAGLTLTAFRRARFSQGIAAPGLVEVIESEVRYFGPNLGGTVRLDDLTEIRLLTLRGRRMWRLKQADGQALLIPVDAAGAEALYDGFTSLPGLDMGQVLAALGPHAGGPGLLDARTPEMALIWHRKGKGLVA